MWGYPGIDGFEVCRAIRQRAATRLTPVVLVTGLHDRQHKMEGIEVGADELLSKPFDEEELTARVDRWCASNETGRNSNQPNR